MRVLRAVNISQAHQRPTIDTLLMRVHICVSVAAKHRPACMKYSNVGLAGKSADSSRTEGSRLVKLLLRVLFGSEEPISSLYQFHSCSQESMVGL